MALLLVSSAGSVSNAFLKKMAVGLCAAIPELQNALLTSTTPWFSKTATGETEEKAQFEMGQLAIHDR